MQFLKLYIFEIILILAIVYIYPVYAIQISSEMREALSIMRDSGIMKGYGDGNMWEDNPVTRWELAVILNRLQKKDVVSWINCTWDTHPWVKVILQDQKGNSITWATIIVNNWEKNWWTGMDRIISTISENNNGTYSFLHEEAWEFLVTIKKIWYSSYQETINISQNQCHVNTQYRTITLFQR